MGFLGLNVHDHLLAGKQWVSDELACAESDFGHDCDGFVVGLSSGVVDEKSFEMDVATKFRGLRLALCGSGGTAAEFLVR